MVTVPGRPMYFSISELIAVTETCPMAMTKDMAATAAPTPTSESSTRTLPMRSCAHASMIAPTNPVIRPPVPVKSFIGHLLLLPLLPH